MARTMNRAILLSAVLALAACSDSPAEIQAKARSAYAAHDYGVARLHLANAVAADPGNRGLKLLQIRNSLALGDGYGAGAALEQLIGAVVPDGELAELSAEAALLRRVPDVALATLGDAVTPEAERLRALAAIQKNDLAKAGKAFAKGLDVGGNARLFADFARYLLITGDGGEAKKLLALAVKAAPDGIDTLLVEGQISLRNGDLARALDRYSRASRLYPSSMAALTGKAATLGDLGRIKEMEAELSRAVAFAPEDQTVVYLRARALQTQQDWAGIRDLVQPFETKLPVLHPARLLYGQALLELGQYQLAIAQLRPFASVKGGNRVALHQLAQALLKSGDAPAAAGVLKPLADDPTASPEALALMAQALKAQGDDEAAKYQARSRFPAPQALIRDLAEGDAAIRNSDWAKAIIAYDRILAVTDGRNAIVLNNMAYSQLMVGNMTEAANFAARALKLAPDNASVLDTAGWVRFKSGKDRPEALRLLRRAAENAPRNATIRAHLAEAERART